jgi:D-alanyl-lipoteichoic acid acyltransferase DltB (MBOAT superfamily)
MLLSGMWHGAGWNYLLWGLMQGLAMGVAYIWPVLLKNAGAGGLREALWYRRYFAVLLTFSFWVWSLVAFRVTNMDDVWKFYATMLSLDWPSVLQIGRLLVEGLGGLVSALSGAESFKQNVEVKSVLALLICFPLVFMAPNVFQYFGVTRNGRIGRANVSGRQALLVGILAAFAVAKVVSGSASDFIYFAF